MSENSKISSDMSFQTFLMANLVRKGNPDNLSITNTRIGDKKSGSGIMGGSYSISENDYPTFLKLYKRDILDKQKSEYLTEKYLFRQVWIPSSHRLHRRGAS